MKKVCNNLFRHLLSGIVMIGFLLLSAGFNNLSAQEVLAPPSVKHWSPGNTITYTENFVETIVGDIPLIISVPHGGFIRPEDMPKRECQVEGQGSLVTGTDSRTIETARAIEEVFLKKYNKRPFIIISNLARTQVDQNRPKELAACGVPRAERAWDDFHLSIDSALALAVEQFGFALYIDLHGHGHKNQRLELGYSLTGPDLRSAYANEDSCRAFGETSSMQNFFQHKKDETFRNLLWGEGAFGTLIQNEGIPAAPAMQDRYPTEEEKFFSGGYNTRRYTSAAYPGVFGWQIECNFKGIRDTEETRAKFAEAFEAAYSNFIKFHQL